MYGAYGNNGLIEYRSKWIGRPLRPQTRFFRFTNKYLVLQACSAAGRGSIQHQSDAPNLLHLVAGPTCRGEAGIYPLVREPGKG